MKYLYTKSNHYTKFLESNSNSNRLSKNLKILPPNGKFINEIFNSPIKCDYTKETKKSEARVVIKFESKLGNKYRLDIFPLKEFNKEINHIAFGIDSKEFEDLPNTLSDLDIYWDDYERPTNRNEMIDILNRLNFILNDLVNKNEIQPDFCIGGTELESKNNIYEYFLKIVVGDNGFTKLKTRMYPKSGWGLYFKI